MKYFFLFILFTFTFTSNSFRQNDLIRIIQKASGAPSISFSDVDVYKSGSKRIAEGVAKLSSGCSNAFRFTCYFSDSKSLGGSQIDSKIYQIMCNGTRINQESTNSDSKYFICVVTNDIDTSYASTLVLPFKMPIIITICVIVVVVIIVILCCCCCYCRYKRYSY